VKAAYEESTRPGDKSFRPCRDSGENAVKVASAAKVKVDMNRKSLVVMWVMIALLVATWLVPPWLHLPGKKASLYYPITFPHRWAFIFDTWQGEYYSQLLIYRIDYQRLAVMDGVIPIIAAGLLASFRKSN